MHESESEVAQSCLTLSDPMEGSLPGSSIHGIFQARVLEWGSVAKKKNHTSDTVEAMHFVKLHRQEPGAITVKLS